jgi:hypothetical protein
MAEKANLRVVRTSRDTDKDYFRELNLLLDRIYHIATHDHHWTWGYLANEAGISPETVIKLGDRITKFPHLRTVIRLAGAVGLDVKLVPIVGSEAKKIDPANSAKKKAKKKAG